VLNTSVNLNGAGNDCLGYRYHTGFEHGESDPSIPRAQDGSVKGGFYLGDQHSATEQDHDPSLSGRERLGFLDHTWFCSAQATRIFSDDFAVRRTDPLLSLPAGIVGSQGITRVPVELPPVGAKNTGIQRTSRRKRSTSPDCRRGGKRTRRKKQRHFVAREQTQVSPAGIGLTQNGL